MNYQYESIVKSLYLLLTYPSSMYSLGFTLNKGILFLFLVFRDGYKKVYRNKYLRGGFDRW